MLHSMSFSQTHRIPHKFHTYSTPEKQTKEVTWANQGMTLFRLWSVPVWVCRHGVMLEDQASWRVMYRCSHWHLVNTLRDLKTGPMAMCTFPPRAVAPAFGPYLLCCDFDSGLFQMRTASVLFLYFFAIHPKRNKYISYVMCNLNWNLFQYCLSIIRLQSLDKSILIKYLQIASSSPFPRHSI